MMVPDHLYRYPTREAIDSLAERFALPNTPDMQDWEYEVSNPARIDEFLDAYLNGGLNDDEKFTLMEMLIDSFEGSDIDLAVDSRWAHVLDQLDRNIELHAHTVWYWSCLDNDNLDECWGVTPHIRAILARHRTRLQG